MTQLTREDLWSLEEYAARRADFRAEVMAHKKTRQLPLGDHARLYFEDATTIRYQIQEMLRIERVFEAAGIEEELSAYNPLIPDGHNWKATFMIEIPDPEQRAVRLGTDDWHRGSSVAAGGRAGSHRAHCRRGPGSNHGR